MLLAKNMIDSVLPSDLRELVDDRNTENLSTVVSNLQINLNKYKDEIKKLAKVNFNDIFPEVENSENLANQISSLHSQINYLKDDLKENEKSLKNVSEIEEYKKLIERIEMINKIVSLVEDLQKFDEHLENFIAAIDTKSFTKCDQLLTNFKSIIGANPSNGDQRSKKISNRKAKDDLENIETIEANDKILSEIATYKQLIEEFTVQKERLWYELDAEWDQLIQIEVINKEDGKLSNDSISIMTGISQDHMNQLTILSAHKTDQFVFISKLKQFSKKFLQFCDDNIISSSKYNINIIEDSDKRSLKVSNDLTETLSASDMLELKLNQVEKVLKFINKNLFSLNVYTSDQHNKKKTLLSIFSDIILQDFVKLIYEKLIVVIIPLNDFDYQLENDIRQKVEIFENNLKEMKFLDKKHKLANIFDSFKNNVEELYVRKKCKFIMEKCRDQMKQKEILFDVIKIDEKQKNPFEDQAIGNLSYVKRTLLNIEESNFAFNELGLDEIKLLRMQTCSVSKIAKNTIKSIYEILNEALSLSINAHDIKNISLLCLISKNLFDLYANVVPTFHRESLQDLPLVSAIIYNDFMYLAFNCLTITHQYKSLFLSFKNDKKIKNLNNSELNEIIENFSCLDLIPKFYTIATESLNKQIEKQQILLMQFLNQDCNGIKDLAEGNNFDQFKRALQKCIFQLNKLSSIWLEILPEQIYLRVFGQFFNFICSDLLKSCLRLEDISTDDASYLEAAFTLIKQSIYDIFSKHLKNHVLDSSEVQNSNEGDHSLSEMTINNKMADLNATKYIINWQKFKYLIKILKGNLQEIVDLWSDSKGPLAIYFDSEEVRHLIRALFMITDKRSAALAKIK